jgi:hypothetical protein
MESGDQDLGPIDVLVIGYPPEAAKTGEAVPIFLGLVDSGIIRVLDVLFVRKDLDGSFASFDPAELDIDTAGDLASFAGAATGLLDDDDVALVAAEIDPGSGAVIIVYENRWAAPFVSAVRRSGGVLITSQRIGVQDLINALDAAEAAS